METDSKPAATPAKSSSKAAASKTPSKAEGRKFRSEYLGKTSFDDRAYVFETVITVRCRYCKCRGEEI